MGAVVPNLAAERPTEAERRLLRRKSGRIGDPGVRTENRVVEVGGAEARKDAALVGVWTGRFRTLVPSSLPSWSWSCVSWAGLGGCEELRRGVVVALADRGLNGLAGVDMVEAGHEWVGGAWETRLSPRLALERGVDA